MNYPYSKSCVSEVISDISIKVFSLMSRTKETRHIEWHGICTCRFRLDSSVCNNQQCCSKDSGRYECRELIDKGICDKGFIWNQSKCECECNKLCDIEQYVDCENWKYRKELVDKLVEECSENLDSNEMTYNGTVNNYGKVWNYCTVYITLLFTFFIILIKL